jgi:hypothetical protein
VQRRRFLIKYQVVGALTDGANPSTVDSLRERGILPPAKPAAAAN